MNLTSLYVSVGRGLSKIWYRRVSRTKLMSPEAPVAVADVMIPAQFSSEPRSW